MIVKLPEKQKARFLKKLNGNYEKCRYQLCHYDKKNKRYSFCATGLFGLVLGITKSKMRDILKLTIGFDHETTTFFDLFGLEDLMKKNLHIKRGVELCNLNGESTISSILIYLNDEKSYSFKQTARFVEKYF